MDFVFYVISSYCIVILTISNYSCCEVDSGPGAPCKLPAASLRGGGSLLLWCPPRDSVYDLGAMASHAGPGSSTTINC